MIDALAEDPTSVLVFLCSDLLLFLVIIVAFLYNFQFEVFFARVESSIIRLDLRRLST